MISPSTIQQIQSRIDIVDIISSFVKLKKRGSNYLGLCPFHNEKTPSFTVSPSKEIYKCFGCGRSGNSISFIMEHEKYSYVEALKWLANKYGIAIEETFATDEQRQQIQTADSLYIFNGFAQQFFTKQLFETEEGQDIGLSYLKERGFREEVIKKFQLGYSPEQRDAFAKEAIAKQHSAELLLKTGLVVNRNEQLLDNYRGRVIFPVHNHSGKVLGFGARILKSNDKAPKYINTPENEIYVKSKILYGSYFARQAIDKSDECLLVEGYTDVLSLHQSGIENVVASGGTSLTVDQLRLVKKYTNNLTIIYDGDAAGIKAALRGLDMALEESLNVKLVLIPDNEDPDSYVKKLGSAAFREFIAGNKKDFVLFQLEVLLREAGNDVNKKNEAVNQVAETISRINKAEDFTKQQEYIRQCAQLLRIDESGLITLVNKYKREHIAKEEKKSSGFGGLPFEAVEPSAIPAALLQDNIDLIINGDDKQERDVLRVLLEYGLQPWDEQRSMAQFIFDELEGFSFENPALEKLYNIYEVQYHQGLEPSAKTLLYYEDAEIRDLVVSITMFPFELSMRWNEKSDKKNIGVVDSNEDVFKSIHYFKLRKLKHMFEQNQRDMEESKSFEEQMQLIKVHKELKMMQEELTKQFGTVIFK